MLVLLLAPLFTRYARRAPLVAAVLVAGLAGPIRDIARAEYTTRTFYGRHQVTMRDSVARLLNGTTAHGTQDQRTAESRLRPTMYYDPVGPLGGVMSDVRGDVGVIGLGAGAIAAYGQPGQTIVFHEIDPAVVDIAQTWFSYLRDSRAHIEIVTGDGRLTVDRVSGRYDVLIVDGFTSDAIPVHLVTAEAFRAYFDAIRDGGVIAVHITNRFVGLDRVMLGIGEQLGVDVLGAIGTSLDQIGSVWVVMSHDQQRLDRLRANGWVDLVGPSVRWTDQRSSLFEVLLPPAAAGG
jgi:spermidine synthase